MNVSSKKGYKKYSNDRMEIKVEQETAYRSRNNNKKIKIYLSTTKHWSKPHKTEWLYFTNK